MNLSSQGISRFFQKHTKTSKFNEDKNSTIPDSSKTASSSNADKKIKKKIFKSSKSFKVKHYLVLFLVVRYLGLFVIIYILTDL